MTHIFLKNLFLFSIILISFAIISCAEENKSTNPREIALERWTVEGTAEQYEKKAIQYLEKTIFNKAGFESGKIFYDQNRGIKAQEVRVFKDGQIGPSGSQYKDPQDSILSYYAYTTNEKGLIMESRAYDANNDDLLRIEKYSYNSNDFLSGKIVLDANNQVSRTFLYSTDEKGNERQVQIFRPDGTEILTEIFEITKFDKQGLWTEKWGFVKDKPFSYLARTITYN